MYSKQEASLLTQQFWTSFGLYLAPIRSAEGEKINWVNYKTGEKDIRFIMLAEHNSAKISITLSHKDTALQKLYFDRFLQFKNIFHQIIGEEWQWRPVYPDQHGKTVSEIFSELSKVNVLNKTDWPAIIAFFKTRMIALDAFWCEYKYAFAAPLQPKGDSGSSIL